MLRIIEDNEPKIRQDIQITKERLETQKQANKKLEEKLATSQQRIRDQEKYIDELRAELSGQKTKYSKLLKSSLYHSDVEAMHRRIS